MKTDVKRLIILNIPYVIAGYLVDKVAWLYRHVEGDLAGMRLVNTFTNFNLAFSNPLPSFHPKDILIGIAGALILKALVYYKGKNAKKFRQGVEYGSARWGTPADIKPYVKRTHGGALLNKSNSSLNYLTKSNKFDKQKEAIAKLAASMIKDDDVIALNTSTITDRIAKYITAKNITVFTNSLEAINTLKDKKRHCSYGRWWDVL